MAEKLPLTNDYVFKRVFAYEGNENVLKDFLEAILNIKINKIQIKNPEILRNYKKDKLGVLDIKVETDKEEIIDVEMQAKDEHNMEERSTTYLGKLIAVQIHSRRFIYKPKKDNSNMYIKLQFYKKKCISSYSKNEI